MQFLLNRHRPHVRCFVALSLALAVLGSIFGIGTHGVEAQDSSLLRRRVHTGGLPPLTLETSSFLYQKPEPLKVLQLNDIVTIVVNINSRMLSEGESEARKNVQLNSVLSDWIKFEKGDLVPDAQRRGDPRISGAWNTQNRATADIETRDSLNFTIAAQVVDVYPNGNLVIEAHQSIQINDVQWVQSLTGTIRREDVTPDNKVLSEDIVELKIDKREEGQVRDGYRRGWFLRLFDKLQPI